MIFPTSRGRSPGLMKFVLEFMGTNVTERRVATLTILENLNVLKDNLVSLRAM